MDMDVNDDIFLIYESHPLDDLTNATTLSSQPNVAKKTTADVRLLVSPSTSTSNDALLYDLEFGSIEKERCSNKNYNSLNLVDSSLEVSDPNPDVHSLFVLYNDQFFWGALVACTVEWSKRMTLSAGLCSFQSKSGFCSIRLSEPLLKLRPRSDIIQTLLHEMIHAYLFVTSGHRDRDGHGPDFQSHMHRINQMANTKITIYHSFHDEVSHYKQHWWRCTGLCRQRKPFYGWIKRAINRAPGPSDPWWGDHKASCDGTFVKVKEPEKKAIKSSKKDSMPSTSSHRSNTIAKIDEIFHPVAASSGTNSNQLDAVQNAPEKSFAVVKPSNQNKSAFGKTTQIALHKTTDTLFPGTGTKLHTITLLNSPN